MKIGEAYLAMVLILLSILGLGLTWTLYSVLNSWNNDLYMHDIGYGLYWLLPLFTAIFSVMFLLIGIYLLHDSVEKAKTESTVTSSPAST